MPREEELVILGLIGLYMLSRARVVPAKPRLVELPPRVAQKVEEVSEIAKEALKTTPEENPQIYKELSEQLRELEKVAFMENVPKEVVYQVVAERTAEKLRQEGYEVQVAPGVTVPTITILPPVRPPVQPQPLPPIELTSTIEIWFTKDSNYPRTIRVDPSVLDKSRSISITVYIDTMSEKCVYINGESICGGAQGLGGGVTMATPRTLTIPATEEIRISSDPVVELEQIIVRIDIPTTRTASVDTHGYAMGIAPEIDVR